MTTMDNNKREGGKGEGRERVKSRKKKRSAKQTLTTKLLPSSLPEHGVQPSRRGRSGLGRGGRGEGDGERRGKGSRKARRVGTTPLDVVRDVDWSSWGGWTGVGWGVVEEGNWTGVKWVWIWQGQGRFLCS